MVTVEQTKKFHKQKQKIDQAIQRTIDKHEIIYGERALNKRFPKFLDRPTSDWDFYTKKPLKDAKEAEKELDKTFGGNFFYIEKGVHKGTYRVKAYANEQSYADYTKPEREIPYDTINGVKFVKLSYFKQHIKETLKDPKAKFRYAKDRDAYNRILIFERLKKNTKKSRKELIFRMPDLRIRW